VRGFVPIVSVQVKERLTGAIILVALIVLLVPELLSGPVRSAVKAVAAPSAGEEPPLRSYTINLAEDGRGHGAAPASAAEPPSLPAPAAAAEPAAAAPAASAPGSVAQTPAASGTNSPPPTPNAALASSASGAYMVQLGSFASRQNAERLAQQLRTQGFGVSVSQGSGGRHLYRVRVGPAHDHGAAEQLAAQLRTLGHSGAIVPR
jgi:DedD protein